MSLSPAARAIALAPVGRPTPRDPSSVRPLRILFVTPRGKKEESSSQKPLFSMAVGILVSITPPQHQIELADELFDDPIRFDAPYDLVGITARTMNATRAYEIADLRFGEGVSTQLELSDSRLQLERALVNRAQAARDLAVAKIRITLLTSLPLQTATAPSF